MTRQRRKFSREQKLEVVRQIEDGERTLSEASHEIDVPASTVSAWRTEWRKLGSKAFPGKGKSTQNDDKDKEIARLKRALASAEEDVEILKKAAAYFAKEVR